MSLTFNLIQIVRLKDVGVLRFLDKLAYMATSGGHFSRPSGMGSFWSYLGAKYLVIVSSRSLKMREFSFAQFHNFLRKM